MTFSQQNVISDVLICLLHISHTEMLDIIKAF